MAGGNNMAQVSRILVMKTFYLSVEKQAIKKSLVN